MTKYFTIRNCTEFFNVTFGPLIDCLRYSRGYCAIQLDYFNHPVPMILTLMSTVAPGCVLLCQYMGKMAANECACKRASINIIAIYTILPTKKHMLSTAHTYRTVCKYHFHMCEHTIIGNITIHNACLPHSSGLFSNASRQNSRHVIPKQKLTISVATSRICLPSLPC